MKTKIISLFLIILSSTASWLINSKPAYGYAIDVPKREILFQLTGYGTTIIRDRIYSGHDMEAFRDSINNLPASGKPDSPEIIANTNHTAIKNYNLLNNFFFNYSCDILISAAMEN